MVLFFNTCGTRVEYLKVANKGHEIKWNKIIRHKHNKTAFD